MEIQEIENRILSSFEIDASLLSASSDNEERFKSMRDLLIRRVEELAEKDMEKLMWILYRIDVSEKRLHDTMQKTPADKFGSTIADLIIERQIKKIETRKQFGGKENDWSFDE
ncbi:MAG: hypothetical protein IPP77_10015 [Bacteroidetes bacterium]|nr:hypothetical protein [Bacteroidota bacterium]